MGEVNTLLRKALASMVQEETRVGGISGSGNSNHMYCDSEQCRTDINNCQHAFDLMHEDKDYGDLEYCPTCEGWCHDSYCKQDNWLFADQFINVCRKCTPFGSGCA
eukprot:TRINITY_DN290_c0_g1_i2.p1 TRINITY_DN290_c0_g1~~TRINITY_DN290_c0_g1_i2.p1  ORF type:complete len:119 (+),score=24.86 TRINITY_DN290_c0_g1_i2:42-359(+)